MLTTLRIKNLALVSDLTLELQPGLNILSGETGAGKSIVIGALTLALGQRADRTLIRSGCDTCSVEAVFDISKVGHSWGAFFENSGLEPCEDGQLLVKRVFTAAGANRQFVNGSPTTLSTLASLGEWLVDIHGPHDHQSLLYPARQLAILDTFGGLQQARDAFGELVRRREILEQEKQTLIVDEKTYAQQLDLLRFQVREITGAKLHPDEETQVEQDHHRASNAARLLEACQQALGLLSEDETSLMHQAGALGRLLQELNRLDPGISSLVTTQEQAVALWQELQAGLSDYADRIDLDPARLQQLEERLNLLHALKRKYGGTVQEVIDAGAELQRKLQQLEQRDEELVRLNAALNQSAKEIWRVGSDLSTQRRKVSSQLGKAVMKELSSLGFKRSQFDVSFQTATPADAATKSWTASGLDTIEFQFAPNLGEPLRPLRTIASSGELARVMLALKTVLAAADNIPVLVFDEVDANVGGETAAAVGEKMRQIAAHRQVLCITHLAPVAAQAHAHYTVTKRVDGGRTLSEVFRLSKDEQIGELARMLGGQTETARRHAAALLKARVD